MPKAKDHVNKLVISTSEGKKLGRIKDLYLDLNLTRVTAVYLGHSGIVKRNKMIIKREQVEKCGIDVWLVEKSDVVEETRNVTASQSFVPTRELRGRRIVSEGGTEIATVEDVILDNECSVVGFSLTKVPASGPISARKAIARGAITNLGSKTTPMTTILNQAESMEIGTLTTSQTGT